ncbi:MULTISPECIES: hypothetical protein [Kocuria]|uniref:hypothetical protein n=1 Tax=Kocuria TaxID=57493 RepID=UPI000A906981|nr:MULTISPECIES: hypothetical protein [Kocuria]MDA4829708.1 hypothetical protein [Kocuria rhizophila]MXN63184.1 hypothetical protein [Bacillus sp. BGMRC0062]
MSERRVWPWVAGAVTVLAVLAVVLFLVLPQLTKGGDTDDNRSSGAAEDASGDLQVVPGMGGSKVAADGRTPVGYQPTCKGAVEAATNYARLLNTHSLNLPKGTDTTIRSVILDPNEASQAIAATSFESIRQASSPDELKRFENLMHETVHPEWSGKYLVRSCDPEKEAHVSVTGVSEGNTGNGKKTYNYVTSTYVLQWSDGDWRVKEDKTGDTGPDAPQVPTLAAAEGMPKPTKAAVTVVTHDGEKFVASDKQELSVTMNSESFSKAFEGVSPDISQWKNFERAGS